MPGDTFNWHKAEDDFLRWFLPSVLTDCKIGAKDIVAVLNEEDPGWTERVKVTMQVNGHEVDGMKFLERIRDQYHYAADQKAAELVRDHIGLAGLDEVVDGIITAIKIEATKRLKNIGVEIRYSDFANHLEDW
jgi:hypothetical protein